MTTPPDLLAGARFLFDREEGRPGEARYRVTVGEGERAAHGEARFASGVLEMGPFDRHLDAWAIDVARAFLRTLAKNHAAAGDWPRRVHRWRAPKA